MHAGKLAFATRHSRCPGAQRSAKAQLEAVSTPPERHCQAESAFLGSQKENCAKGLRDPAARAEASSLLQLCIAREVTTSDDMAESSSTAVGVLLSSPIADIE